MDNLNKIASREIDSKIRTISWILGLTALVLITELIVFTYLTWGDFNSLSEYISGFLRWLFVGWSNY